MMKIRIFLLALALALVPALLAVELADEHPAGWLCGGPANFPDLTCHARCIQYDGSNVAAPEYTPLHCPGSSVRSNCADQLCTSEEECRQVGLPYFPCHDRESWVCAVKAQRENQVRCPVTGPPGSAIKLGDCVLRIVKDPYGGRVQVRHECFKPTHHSYRFGSWKPTHPEELEAWFYSDLP